jgi:hypothetical protein
MNIKLRLGPVPTVPQVRITITLTAELSAALDRYAKMHAQSTGESHAVPQLIPYMLRAFITSDRAFAAASRASKAE